MEINLQCAFVLVLTINLQGTLDESPKCYYLLQHSDQSYLSLEILQMHTDYEFALNW